MNRREAIAALTALPEATRISRARLKPGDVVVVETDMALSPEMQAHIKRLVTDVWPDHRCLVCDRGIRLRFVSDRASS
jgi:hypothetical protein